MPTTSIAQRITVVLVDQHALLRAGLRQLLEADGIEVVGEAASGEAGLRLVERYAPDVAIVDPGLSDAGADPIRRIKASAPGTHVLALAAPASGPDVVDVMRMGGSCYLLKEAPVETILDGVRAAAAGEALISPQVAATLVRSVRAGGPGDGPTPRAVLSEREQEVLRLMTDGKENDEIASDLFISPHTVKNHISSILLKLEVTNRVQAAVRAVREAMV
jgi:DNA-binding NarL/FixJ family response regulator